MDNSEANSAQAAEPRRHADKFVFIACPCGDCRMDMKTAMAIIHAVQRVGNTTMFSSRSILTANFNAMWCSALNARMDAENTFPGGLRDGRPAGPTHFLMIHSDVIPIGDNWLVEMLDEADRVGANVLSAVIPIKDHQGLSSTAIAKNAQQDIWARRRLTLTEISKLPRTFSSCHVESVLGITGPLLVNTGLMLVDLRKPWVQSAQFSQQDYVYRDAAGRFVSNTEPEDWDFSVRAHVAGASVWATTHVTVHHAGRHEYPNVGAWGMYTKDPNGIREPGEAEDPPRENVTVFPLE